MKKPKLFFVGLILVFLGLTFFSCSNSGGITPTRYARLQVVNTLAGSTPFNFYLNSVIQSKSTITFPASSGYISVTPGQKYFQASFATTPLLYFYFSYITLGVDSNYSVFVTGLSGKDSSIVTYDNLAGPSNGKAKVRFINTSTNSVPLDITINAVLGYKSVAYKSVSPFIEVPAGTYEFKAYPTGTTNNTLATLSNQTLADGKVYTLYAAGQTGSTTANAAFGLNLITNLLPATK